MGVSAWPLPPLGLTLAKLPHPWGLTQMSPMTLLVLTVALSVLLCLSPPTDHRHASPAALPPPFKFGALLLGSKTACISLCILTA